MPDQVLTSIELVVIALARDDPPSSLVQRRGLVRQMFGRRVRHSLAAPRLEALRRYAILRRVHDVAFDGVERERLRAIGFDDSQIGAIDRLICADSRSGGFTQARPRPA